MNIHAPTTSPLTLLQLTLDPLPNLPVFQPLLDLYDSKRRGRLMPCWKDFKFSEFVGWHARIALSRREDDDCRFRIFGSAFVELFDNDLTGELLAASMVPEQKPEIMSHFKHCIDGPYMGLVTGRVPAEGRGFLGFEVIDLPLMDKDGEVSHFLHVCVAPGLGNLTPTIFA